MRSLSRAYVLIILTAAYALSFVDRQILSLLVTPVKSELSLSDLQVGLLQGLAFALLYMLLGLPFGRLADRVSRKALIAGGIGFWSVMTAACGLARNFPELFLARIGVGVGEASLQPAAYSLLADHYPPEKLSTALSIFSIGAWLGMGSAFLLGGSLEVIAHSVAAMSGLEWSGWRLFFLALGIAGIPVCGLVLLTREVRRQRSDVQLPLAAVGGFLKDHRGMIGPLFFGYALILLIIYAFLAWVPAVMLRVHGWSPAEVGRALGLCTLLLSPLGALSGGFVSDRLVGRGQRAGPVIIGVVEAVLLLPCLAGLAFVDSGTGALLLIGCCLFLGPFSLGSATAAVQMITPPPMRGIVSAVYLLVVSLVGTAGGPALTGFYTDYVFADERRVDDSLALVAVSILPFAILLLVLAARRIARHPSTAG